MQVVTGHSSPELPRVVVIDGNLLTAEAIVLALGQRAYAGRFVVPVAADHLRDMVVAWRPRLALLDIDSVDGATSLECLGIMQGADIPVAVMGGKLDQPLLGRCIHAGASSVVDKSSPLGELVGLIGRHLAGEVVLGDEVRRQLTEDYRRQTQAQRARLAPFEVLTRREKFVLSELMDGHAAEAIARSASVSISTVRSQIKAILQKLGVNSQLAAAGMARQAGWTLSSDGARQDVAVRPSP
jgi:two-component system, NarL family, nitrate/nitrite response regulator NarL